MDKLEISKECVRPLLETRFIKVYDLQYREGKHYYDATRRDAENLAAIKTDGEFSAMLPDAVTCFVIVKTPDAEPRLLLSYEYRYPVGRFLLSPPAGLIDKEDATCDAPLLTAAKREIQEETGISLKEGDALAVVNPLSFSSPGFTDESNALVAAVVSLPDLSALSQAGAVGSERFDGFELLTRAQAEELLENGTDGRGHFYSVYTWCALMYFLSDRWKKLL